ncbi:hypothetical protein [Frateuria soli]|uniref:hypothetical protein n=1 Tax=Frateuria soli TaxID=1542730 RepID=UPI001E60A782|nr:hypothetical protein [Frateuria soli]UGB39387.1 hypothetical protein LQ771_05970 [Frateuria soli]
MKKAILKGLLFGALLTGSAGATARGYYEFIPYYGNDPFLFCTLGVPTDCWAPISAATGTFTVTNYYCFNAVSAAQFARVCPHAFIPEASILRGHDPLRAPVSRSAPARLGKGPDRV